MKIRLIAILFAITVLFAATPVFADEADATSAQGIFFYTSYTGSIGSIYEKKDLYENQAVRFNPKAGATYSAVSDNGNVLKVTATKVGYDELFYEENGKVFFTGFAEGSANITLKQTYKGSTTTVGKVKVTIAKADISATSNYNHEFGLGSQYSGVFFTNRAATKASYTFKVDKEGLTFSTKKQESGSMSIQINATAYGKYVVSAYETINGKARKIKDMTFNIKKEEIPDSITIKEPYLQIQDQIKFQDKNYTYGLNIKGQYVFEANGGGWVPIETNTGVTSSSYTAFTDGAKDTQEVGNLHFSKPGTVKADVYRVKRGSTEVEFVKTISVTYKK